jgi:hypothetical protein
MKKNRLLLVLVLLVSGTVGLTSCGDETSTSEVATSVASIPSYKIRNITIDVAEDFTYDISFKPTETVEEDVKFYTSSNSTYSASDKEIDMSLNSEVYSFNYSENSNDFYILMVGGTENDVYAKQNIVLPTFNATIVDGTDTNDGYDILTFSYLDNGYGSETFFDDEGVNIYRSASSEFNESTATLVEENVTIADEFDIASAEGENYYFIQASSNGGIATYTSQAFEKNVKFGSDLISITSAEMASSDSIYLNVEGTYSTSESLENAGLSLFSSVDNSLTSSPIVTDSDNGFTASFDLSQISTSDTTYTAYIQFGAGIFYEIPYDVSGENADIKNVYDSKIYGFTNTNDLLGISYQDKGAVNIFSAKFELEEDNPYFVVSGMYDETLFTDGSEGVIYNPILLINNDQNSSTDNNEYALTLDEENGTFEVKADLSSLSKLGSWYNVKLYFNTTTTTDDDGAEAYLYDATYEFSENDAYDLDSTVLDPDTFYQYGFETYSSYLKIYYTDASSNVDSWDYVRKDGEVYLRLQGTYRRGNESQFDVTYGDEHYYGDVIPYEETYEFVSDINVNSVQAGVNYSVYWRYASGGSDEVTNKYITKPNAVASSNDGYIYCVKEESWETNRYYKVYKDQDTAKANEVAFETGDDNSPEFIISGAVNSSAASKDLYLQFEVLDLPETAFYSEVSLDADLNFSTATDISTITDKDTYYEVRLVEKTGGEYIDISSGDNDYCGFYNEYLPSDFADNILVTDSGTYKVNTHTGEDSLWSLYIYLA